MTNSLLSAALSAVTNTTVIIHDDYDKEKVGDYDHNSYLVGGKVLTSLTSPREGQIFIKLIGRTVTLWVDFNDTLDQVKQRILFGGSIPPNQAIVMFAGKKLEDGRTLTDYNIKDDSMLHLMLKLRGDGDLPLQSNHYLDPRYDRDFTDENDKGKTFSRGNFEYKRPCGWKRFALNVLNKNEDNIWLGVGGCRQFSASSVQNEWPVSYHGTAKHNGNSIAEDGYFSCMNQLTFGYGFYSTPDIDVASKYAKFTYEGDNYHVVFQNRINPNNLVKIPNEETGVGEYWISPDGNNLRPYGICIKKDKF